MGERRRNQTRRGQVDEILKLTRRTGMNRRIVIAESKERITVAEVIAVVTRNHGEDLIFVKDTNGRVWDIPLRPDVREEGVVSDHKLVRPGADLIIHTRLMHVTAPETVAYTSKSSPAK